MIVVYYDNVAKKMMANIYNQPIKIKPDAKYYHFEENGKTIYRRQIYITDSVEDAKNYVITNYSKLKEEFPKWTELDNKIKLIENKKALYIFSLDNRVEEYELDGITNYKVEAIPQKIYDLYRKLVKLSKEN